MHRRWNDYQLYRQIHLELLRRGASPNARQHEQGVAPQLLYCNFEPTVGKIYVVMEYIQVGKGKISQGGVEKLM